MNTFRLMKVFQTSKIPADVLNLMTSEGLSEKLSCYNSFAEYKVGYFVTEYNVHNGIGYEHSSYKNCLTIDKWLIDNGANNHELIMVEKA